MDNALYHSALKENYPKRDWRKANIQKWLTEENIKFNPLAMLPELRQKIRNLIP